MPTYECHFFDGSIDEIDAASIADAKERGRELNDCGVRKAILISNDDDGDDEDEEDENPEDEDEDDDEDDDEEDDDEE